MFKKILATGGGIVTFASIGAGLFLYSKKPKIEEHDISKLFSKFGAGKTKLTDDMNDFIGWTLRWRQYIKDNSENGKPKENDAWGLEDWQTASKDNNKVPPSFADKCNSFQKHKVKDEQDPAFKNYINWCTK